MAQDTPVLHDVNFNGKLDGTDLAKAMVAEEKVGGWREPSERVHGLLEIAGVLDVSVKWHGQILSGNKDPKIDSDAAADLNRKIADTVNKYNKDPKKFIEDMKGKDRPWQYKGSDELLHTDLDSFAAFAKTFAQKFKGGVDIKPAEISEVLGHFPPQMIIIPEKPDKSRRQPSQGGLRT